MGVNVGNVIRKAAMLLVGIATANICWAQNGDPWQVGDVVVCYGTGHCNVMRIVGGTPTLLDTLNDGLLGTTSGTAINNTLHLLTTDNAGGNASNVIQWSIASVNPLTGSTVSHSVLNQFNGGGQNVQAVVVNGAGHMFVANAGSGGSPVPSIVELNPNGTLASPSALPTNPFTVPGNCIDPNGHLLSIDLSASGSSLYLTSGQGTIQNLMLATGICTPFANFGNKVNLYTVKDIPAGALTGQTCGKNPCPTDESLLVAATGFIDDVKDSDAVNICTNDTTSTTLSCALLIDTNPNPGLPAQLWKGNNQYFTLGASILDPNAQVQSVSTEGTSGSDEPSFNDTTAGGLTIDNAVKWTDIAQPAWHANNPYSVGTAPLPTVAAIPNTYFVDPSGHLETVSTAGTSGPVEPGMAGNPVSWSITGGTTIDGLQWQDQSFWQANTPFAVGAAVGDANGHPHVVLAAGTSGAGPIPAGTVANPGWNDSGSNNGGLTTAGITVDNAVIWTNEGTVVHYTGNHLYSSIVAPSIFVLEGGHAQQAVEPGTSGGTAPNFSTSGGRTIDNAVTWADLGAAVWLANFSYGLNAIVVDGGGHVQQVTTIGTSGTTLPAFVDGASPGGTATDGLQWQESGTKCGNSCNSPWTSGTQYAAGSVIDDNGGFEWNAITGGTSGSAANRPAFESNETPGLILTDNVVVWTDQGLLSGSTVFNWQKNNAYALDAEIVDPGNHVQVVSVAGTSGPNQPTFNDGGNTTDNSVQWSNLGQAVWRASFSYGLNAIIVDNGGHVQQITAAGTTGSTIPTFPDDGSSSTPDGTVVWTDRGSLASSTFVWKANTGYNQNAMIVDNAGQVELATTATGTSGAGPNPPTFSDGGNVVDGLVWLDIGPTAEWKANASFGAGVLFVDPGSFLQEVTTAGISGTPSQPSWVEIPGGMTVDGLQWSDVGHSVWTMGTPFSVGTFISELTSPYHAQEVYEAGTSGGSAPLFNHIGGLTQDNVVIWTESNPNPARQPSTAYVLNSIVVDSFIPPNVQQVSLAGITGPNGVSFSDTGGTTVDGLQWKNATATSSVVARYAINNSTVQAQTLALDPLIADCTVSKCSLTAQLPTARKFWMGDSSSSKFFSFNFNSTGLFTTYDASTACPACNISSIQSIALYGGEGSNQPDLTMLFSGTVTPTAPGNTAAVQFPLPVVAADTNSFTVSLYSLPQNYGMNLYASLVDPNSCFSDPSIANPSLPCQPTTSLGKPIVWKTDVPTTGALALIAPAYVSEKVKAPSGVDFNTDVFTDAFYDTTVASGNIDPVAGNKSSVELLVERAGANLEFPNAGCVYSSPVSGACYKTTRTTLNFIFQCPGLSQSDFLSLQNPPGPPLASLVQILPQNSNGTTPSPKIIYLTKSNGTNGKAPYRYSSSNNSYTFQWNLANAVSSGQVSATGTTNLTLFTYDEGVIPPFGISFKTDPTCK